VFTLEYLLRIYVADSKPRFIFSFFGIIDLLAIIPFYLSFGIDLRSLRALRFLRLFRILKLVRYNKAMNHFTSAIKSAKEEILLFVFITLILIYFSAVGIYYFENEAQPEHFTSIFDSLWWAIITLTTVGYGDVYPITVGGKVFTFFILMIGLGIVAIPTGIISSALTKSIDTKETE
jgi:voltage-gated potassium channel